jgi:hypothetical protein
MSMSISIVVVPFVSKVMAVLCSETMGSGFETRDRHLEGRDKARNKAQHGNGHGISKNEGGSGHEVNTLILNLIRIIIITTIQIVGVSRF